MAAHPCCSHRFSFILADGTEVFPVQLQNRDATRPRYRVSPGRRGGHALCTGEDVDEATMFQKVVNQGYAIRCTSANGAVCGLFRRCLSVLCIVSQP